MGFGNGRGGLFTVLLGLFVMAVNACGYVLFWALVAVVWLLIEMGKSIAEGYRYLKRGREMHEPYDLPQTQRLDDLPMPPTSPVEYRDNDWS
jgi:hypothetical protein